MTPCQHMYILQALPCGRSLGVRGRERQVGKCSRDCEESQISKIGCPCRVVTCPHLRISEGGVLVENKCDASVIECRCVSVEIAIPRL
jgi:hypothetical protein